MTEFGIDRTSRALFNLFCVIVAAVAPGPALADDPLPPLAIAARETFDVFDVPKGSDPGAAILNKIQVSATARGDSFGLEGWSIHGQIIRFDGQSLSRHLGDIQTADNIETETLARLFEAYLAKTWGGDEHSVAIRVGLIDLNSQFDSIDPASLMLNSSHGIAPDLSRSGLNGPSIYPVTAFGSTITWVRSKKLTFRLGVFDGVAGDPTEPRAFFAERLKSADGLLLIGQTDWQLTPKSRLEAGAWGYTAGQVGPASVLAHDRGAYVSYEGPLQLPAHLSFWLRAGIARGSAQLIAGYIGGGLVQQGVIEGRPDDRVGIAVAHAILGDPAVAALGLPHAETSIEATYQFKASSRFIIQPDVDYIYKPAGRPRARDGLGLGLRLVLAGGYPARMAAADAGDPTIPPDGAPSTSDDTANDE